MYNSAKCSSWCLGMLFAALAAPLTAAASSALPKLTAPELDVTPQSDADEVPAGEPAVQDPARSDLSEGERYYNLGKIQQANGELDAAVGSYETSLEAIRRDQGQWSQALVPVLRGLGTAHQDLGEHESALALFSRALYLKRMNSGLHDLSQIPVLEEQIESRIALDDWERAQELQQREFLLRRRAYGSDSVKLVPGMYDLADWYLASGRVYAARALYEQAVELLESEYGDSDPRLVPALKGIAASHKRERYPVVSQQPDDPSFTITTNSSAPARRNLIGTERATALSRYGDGEQALKRAVSIQQQHAESIPARERGELLTQLADWYLMFDKWNHALETYQRARQTMIDGGMPPARVERMFAEPYPLVFPLPGAPSPPPWKDNIRRLEGYITISYDVTKRGRVKDVEILESEPEDLMEFRVRKALRASRFRPRLEAGAPVASDNIRYRHTFDYYGETQKPRQEERREDGGDSKRDGQMADA